MGSNDAAGTVARSESDSGGVRVIHDSNRKVPESGGKRRIPEESVSKPRDVRWTESADCESNAQILVCRAAAGAVVPESAEYPMI